MDNKASLSKSFPNLIRFVNEVRISIIDAAPDAMLLVDPHGVILHANNQIEALFGYSATELTGQMIEILVPERFRNKHPGHRNNYFKNPHPRPMGMNLDLYALHKSTSEFPVEISLSPLDTEEGTLGLVAIRDISHRKQYENELQSLNTKLTSSNKELEKFAYVTSHDLKAPLRGIVNLVDWIEEDCAALMPDKSKEYFSLLKGRVKRMDMLINSILQYSRINRKSLPITLINIKDLLKTIIESNSIPSSFHITLHGEMPELHTYDIHLRYPLI